MAYATVTARAGKITTGGSATALAPYNPARNGFSVRNQSTGDLWLNEIGGAASDADGSNSLRLAPGGYYETPSNGCGQQALSIFGATTGQAFYFREW